MVSALLSVFNSVRISLICSSYVLERGKLFGSFGIKILFIVGVSILEVGAVISGAASTMDMPIIGRAIGGFGGKGLCLGAMNIIAAFTSMKESTSLGSSFGLELSSQALWLSPSVEPNMDGGVATSSDCFAALELFGYYSVCNRGGRY